MSDNVVELNNIVHYPKEIALMDKLSEVILEHDEISNVAVIGILQLLILESV